VRGVGVLVETWTDDDGSVFNVVRMKFDSLVTEIVDALNDLPVGSKVWETLAYEGETVEIVFRAVAATTGVAA
jgi:hypothetical protein